MAGPSSPIPWADIDALFADLPGYGTTPSPDAARQASEDTQTESFESMLADASVDFLAGPSGGTQMLEAPHPDVGGPFPYIDPALLILTPSPAALPITPSPDAPILTPEPPATSDASAEKIRSLNDLIERYKAGEKRGNQGLNDYKQRNRGLETGLTEQKTAADDLRGKNHLLEMALETRAASYDALQATLTEQKNAADDLRNKNQLLEMALEHRNSNYDELQTSYGRQHAELDSKDAQIKTHEERIRQLTGEVKQHLASIAMADEEITRLGNVAKETDASGGNQRHQRRVLKAKVENLEVELESTTEELQEAKAEIKALEVDNREKGYKIDRLEDWQGSYREIYIETVTLQNTLKAQDEDMVAMKGNLQDLEEEIARLRSHRRGGSSRSESRGEAETERVPGVGGYTTLEGVFGENDEEDDHHGGEPAGPAEGTETEAELNVEKGSEEGDEAGGEVDVEAEEEEGSEVEGESEEEETRTASVEPAERMVEVPTMVYCPWMWWKMPYQAFLLLLIVEGFPSVFAVFWKFVGFHLFAGTWPLVRFFGRRTEHAPHSTRPRHLTSSAKVVMLLAWHLVVYACIGALLWHLSGTMAERTMWIRANQLSRTTLIGLRESLRQKPNFGNPVVRFTWRLVPKAAGLEWIVGRWLPGRRGVFG